MTLMICATAFCCLTITSTAANAAPPDEAKSILGKWAIESEKPDGSLLKWILNVTEVEGKLAAAANFDKDPQTVRKLVFKDNQLKFALFYDEHDVDFDMKLDESQHLTGSWSTEGSTGKTTGMREPAKP